MDIKANELTVVCFDLDDTLYNELDFLKSAYKEIANSILGAENETRSLYTTMLSLYFQGRDVFGFLSEQFKLDKRLLIEQYRNHKPNIKPFDGVIPIFEQLKRKKSKIAIITDGRSTTQRQKLTSLSLYHLVDLFVISDEMGSEKPELKNFQIVMDTFQNAVYYYFGDNYKKDFLGPNKLGWHSIAVADNGKNIHKHDLTVIDNTYFPKEIIYSFDEVRIL